MFKIPAPLRSTNALLLVAALAAGSLSFWAASRYVTGQAQAAEARVTEKYRKREVLVASANLAPGTPLDTRTLAQRSIPARYVGSDAIGAEQAARVIGRRLSRPLKAGDPLPWSAIEAPETPRLSAALESGLRAITFPVDDVNSFSGMLTPGDIIDLLYTVEGEARGASDRERPFTVTPLLEAVKVLATGSLMRRQTVRGRDGQEREVDAQFVTVTLHVTPADAARIIVAQRSGELTAVLRGPQDRAPLQLRSVDSRSLRPQQAGRASAGSVQYVEYIIGGRGNAQTTRERIAVAAAANPARSTP